MNDPRPVPTREEVQAVLAEAGYHVPVNYVFRSLSNPDEIVVVLEGRAAKIAVEYTFKAGSCSKP